MFKFESELKEKIARLKGAITAQKSKLYSAMVFAIVIIAIFAAVNVPTFTSAAATTRQLPIYSVERDQKMVSLSFDAAWGDVRVR